MGKAKKKGKKPGPKKSELRSPKSRKNVSPKAAKRRRFVEGLIDGKSMRKAALDAGYTPAMADKAGEKIFPAAQKEFREQLDRAIPNAVLIKRIAEGLNAKETRLAQFEGEYTDTRHLTNWSERRRYVELATKLKGYLVDKVELGGPDGGKIPLTVEGIDEALTKLLAAAEERAKAKK